MWWKLYFWIIAILIILAFIASGFDGTLTKYTFADWVSVFISIPSLIGLYVFAYKKQLSTAQFWKVVLWITIILDAYCFAYYSLPTKNFIPEFLRFSTTLSGLESVFVLIFDLPFLYVTYQLAYNARWYQREDKKFSISLISQEKTGWWKVSAVIVFIYGLLFLLVQEIIPEMDNEGKIVTAVLGALQLVGGVLIWYRINLALFLSVLFFTIRGILLLSGGKFEEFFINTIVFIILFVTILKVWTKVSKV